MKLTMIAIILSATVCAWPTQAAPSSKTLRWERAFFPAMGKQMCKPGGAMIKTFKITPASCRTTYRYAAKHCRHAVHRLPFYRVSNRSLALTWGKWLGACVGTAYDMKHTYKLNIP